MTKISAKVIADSKNEFGNRITTMIVTFPRFILAELNTHRMMSRNSASSRAIPFEKMIASVENDPFVPIAFQKDHKGMQGTEYLEGDELHNALQAYRRSVDYAINRAKDFAATGVTKQLVNRQLEAYMWHTVIVTATEWENFFALRCPKYVLGMEADATNYRSWKDVLKENELDEEELNNPLFKFKCNQGQAEIHMMELAEQIWDAMNESTPKELKAGEWHIPLGENLHDGNVGVAIGGTNDMCSSEQIIKGKVKIATANAAGISYTIVGEDGKQLSYEKLIARTDKLAIDGHWSCFEHCAQAMSSEEYVKHIRTDKASNEGYSEKAGYVYDVAFFVNDNDLGWSGNFKGFIQYRKTFNNENITK